MDIEVFIDGKQHTTVTGIERHPGKGEFLAIDEQLLEITHVGYAISKTETDWHHVERVRVYVKRVQEPYV